MAVEKTLLTWSWPASVDLSDRQYRAVTLTAGRLAVAGAGAHAWGILQDQPRAIGEAGLVMIHGVSKAVVDGLAVNVAVGDPLRVGTDGRLIRATLNRDRVIGHSLEAVTADRVVASVLLTPFAILTV
ncbi:MAG: hypothetical protein DDT40_01087 [candidate division WS2 bacterium]|nr:hypothetical protein [Candidatus Psychracetigena formicireducens]